MPNKSTKKKKLGDVCDVPSMPYEEFQNLQVTINEIDSWAEKSKLILERSTAELNKVSQYLPPKKSESTTEAEQILKQHSSLNSNRLKDMKWDLSFQPGNLLRIDTNITSVEELIEAAQQIRQIQQGVDRKEDCQEQNAVEICSSSVTTSSALFYQAADYWLNALSRNPQVDLEDYKHCSMNLDSLLNNMTPEPLRTILEDYWDCPHPKFGTDWDSFWNRSGDTKLNQLCTDSALSRVFFHIMRHNRNISPDAQSLAGHYFDRARHGLMEYFDTTPNFTLIEAIINMSVSWMICKRYSKSFLYMDLAYRKWLELGANHGHFKNDTQMRKDYLFLRLSLQFNAFLTSNNCGERNLIDDSDMNYREIISLDHILLRGIKSKEKRTKFEKEIIREAFYICMLELVNFGSHVERLVMIGTPKETLLEREEFLRRWSEGVPSELNSSMKPHGLLKKRLTTLLKMEYERQWINTHKSVLNRPDCDEQQSTKSREQCVRSASMIVELGEYYSARYKWCVNHYFLVSIYQASTVFCMFALDKTENREKCKTMILRIMNILGSASEQYEGMPDGMAQTLCEFLKSQDLHDDHKCACNTYLKSKGLVQPLQPPLTINNDDLTILGFDDELIGLKQILSSTAEPL